MADQPVLLITGTSRGIGRGMAEYFAANGYCVAGCSRSDPGPEAAGFHQYRADVSDEIQVRKLVRAVIADFSRLDGLVNNAGAAAMNHLLLTPISALDRVLSANLRSTFLASRECGKIMAARGGGRIVNFSSVAVPLRLAGEAVYAASKGAVETLTRIMARELAPSGITCNAVGPPPIATDLIRGVPPAKINAILQQLAIPRLAEIQDVINAVEFFLRPQSSMITGQVLYLGGAG